MINAAFTNNSASNNGTTGMHIEAAGGTFNVESFTGNTVTNNMGNGVWFDANNTAGGGTINVTNFQGNTITNNGTAAVGPIGSDPDGLLISAQGGTAVVNAAIGVLGGQPNNIANNGSPGIGGAGIHVFVNSGGVINGSIVNNTINDNVSFGINIDGLDGTIGKIGSSPSMAGAVPFLIESNTISGNGDAGIWVRLQNNSTAGVQILSNSIVNQINGPSPLAGGEGIHFRTEGTSFEWDADIENNFIGIGSNGSAGPNISNGIEFESFGNSRLADTLLYPGLSLVKIINNIIEFNGGDGINFQRNGDSLVNDVEITKNTIKFNLGNGMNLIMNGGANDISNGGAPLTINFDIQQNNVSNNGINGIVVAATADAVFRPIITDNVIENNGQDGINSSTLYFSQVEGTWSNNTIEFNGRDGIRFTDGDESGPSFNVTVANNTIENNLADGIFYTSVETIPLGGGNGTVDIDDNLIKENGGNGVNVEPTGFAVANINLTDNQIIFNTLDGVRMQADEFSVITTTSSGNTITNNGADGWQLTTQAGLRQQRLFGQRPDRGHPDRQHYLVQRCTRYRHSQPVERTDGYRYRGNRQSDVAGQYRQSRERLQHRRRQRPARHLHRERGRSQLVAAISAQLLPGLDHRTHHGRPSPSVDCQSDGDQRERHERGPRQRDPGCRRRHYHQRRHQPVRLRQCLDHQQPLLRQREHRLRDAVVRLDGPAKRHQLLQFEQLHAEPGVPARSAGTARLGLNRKRGQ